MPYMLVRLQCAVGKTQQFNEVMSHFVPILEDKGWILRGAFATSIGRLNRCYDLWEMPDANHISSVLQLAAQEPEFVKWGQQLAECLEEEELEFMDELPYSLEARRRRGEIN